MLECGLESFGCVVLGYCRWARCWLSKYWRRIFRDDLAGAFLGVPNLVIRNLKCRGESGRDVQVERCEGFFVILVFLRLSHFMSPPCWLEQTQVSASKHINQPTGSWASLLRWAFACLCHLKSARAFRGWQWRFIAEGQGLLFVSKASCRGLSLLITMHM